MDRYLQIRHGIFIGGAKPCGYESKAGPIIVVVPFETGQAQWAAIEHVNGQVIEGETVPDLVHEVIQDDDTGLII